MSTYDIDLSKYKEVEIKTEPLRELVNKEVLYRTTWDEGSLLRTPYRSGRIEKIHYRQIFFWDGRTVAFNELHKVYSENTDL